MPRSTSVVLAALAALALDRKLSPDARPRTADHHRQPGSSGRFNLRRGFRAPCRIAGIGSLLLLAASLPAAETKLTKSVWEAVLGPRLGWSVAISGVAVAADWLIAGAPGYDGVGYHELDMGALAVFELGVDGWASNRDWLLLWDDSWMGSMRVASLGHSVSMWGDRALAGAPYCDHATPSTLGENIGAFQIWTRDDPDWSRHQSYGREAGDTLGYSVSIQGMTVGLGVPHAEVAAGHYGAVSVQTLSGGYWNESALLAAPDAGEGFGLSVSVWSDRIAVGAPNDDETATNGGAVYVFRNSGGTWSFEQKLTASDVATDDIFGAAVSMSGNYLAVGAPNKNSGRGRVYVFQLSSGVWSQVANLSAHDGGASDAFGGAVALFDPRLVVGAQWDDENGAESGAIYGFRRLAGGYTEVGKRNAGDGLAGDEYGFSVSLYQSDLAVGAPYATVGDDYQAGAAYVYGWSDLEGHLFSDGFERGNESRWSASTL